jgi:putative flippase GtrA
MKKLIRFLVAGLPAFLLAIPLNWALVTHLAWPKPAAYAMVLAVQITLNYFACRLFVFEVVQGVSAWKSFAVFVNGILLFRVLDWGVYSLLTTKAGLPFLAVQLFNVLLFGLLKYQFSKRVFEAGSVDSNRPTSTPCNEPGGGDSTRR